MNDLESVHKILEAGLANIPQPQDTSKYALFSFYYRNGGIDLLMQTQILCATQSIHNLIVLSSVSSSGTEQPKCILSIGCRNAVLCLLLSPGNISTVRGIAYTPTQYTYNSSIQILGSEGTEEAILAIPC